ncbi:hypothetical protein Mtc_1036 [Methanocella conradii HZ254]|uniref:DZANK-type domain-containing protein n=1 Tax=Methanocella conradii (strain DSM 24694 / JCM 17849 / CGMCC 1.5162 / HZ254) TaxID=1041930 RepID=H8I5X5_METCZ|nr:hypothetical protein [Methanocella conradii]AFC99792.1 hypothetical protein Mtc_1036 [Methanocella conradii HZ254]MDI6896492.1 hypothetical protein [Methanocella conradii]
MTASYLKCSRCGRATDESARCAICGIPLCMYDMRVLEEYGLLCPRCYEDASFQYHSRKCDASSGHNEL